jgi:hypothetical protein
MLSAAAQRADLCLTAPNKLKGAILAKVSDKLMKFGLVREVRAKAGAPVWRRGNAGRSYALKLTTSGLKAIAVDDGLNEARAPREAPQPQSNPDATRASGTDIVDEHAKTPMPRAGSKLARVIDLLRRSDGATISNLAEATGWLPHTTRAALTGLRKRGYTVIRERISAGNSVYRISEAPAGEIVPYGGARPWIAAGPNGRRCKRRSRVTYARADSWQAGKRPTAATPGASLPLDASLLSIVANLEGLDLDGLRRQWRAHLGGEAPAHLPRWLLIRVLAYRLQSDAFGDLDKSIRRILRSGKEDGGGTPFDRRAPQTREGLRLKAGALLVREWNGKLERVMILEEGFAWNGGTFGSLSQIAKAMTGTNWNGHRFFGLRRGKAAVPYKDRSQRSSRGRAAATAEQDAASGDAP